MKNAEGDCLITCTYEYAESIIDGELRTSEFIESISYDGTYEKIYTYTYDKKGNISSIYDGTYKTSYYYDYATNLLTRENNEKAGKTWIYTYKSSCLGNISHIDEYEYTMGVVDGTPVNSTHFEYSTDNWKNQLSTYNGESISYDAQGNPTSWINDRELIWQGIQLQQLTEATGDFVQYDYNADGVRTKKIWTYSDGSQDKCEYIVNGSAVLGEFYTDSLGTTDQIFYCYDSNGSPLCCEYNHEIYYYIKNIQGDITALTSKNGTVVVTYDYDAWGKLIGYTTTSSKYEELANRNSLRYRGYIYDSDTELYYTENRYYDPEVARFLNAKNLSTLDSNGDVFDYNLYLYALGNPVNYGFKNDVEMYEIIQPKSPDSGCRSTVTDTLILYDIPVYDQGSYNLCWAYCWVSTYYYREHICKSNIEAYKDEVLFLKTRFDPIDTGADTNRGDSIGEYTLQNLYNQLENSGPLYACYQEPYVSALIPQDGHVVVIIGVDLEKEIVYTYNPWGIVASQRYEDFLQCHTNEYGNTATVVFLRSGIRVELQTI